MVVKNEENTAIESNNRMSESSNDSLDDSGSQSSLKRQLKVIFCTFEQHKNFVNFCWQK